MKTHRRTGRSNLEAIQGLLVLVMFVGGGFAYRYHTREHPLIYRVTYDEAQYLKAGDSVYLSGVEVGEVLDIRIEADRTVSVEVAIQERFRPHITEDLRHAIIYDKILFGRKAILLQPVGERGEPIRTAQVIEGTDSYRELVVDQGSSRAESLFENFKEWSWHRLREGLGTGRTPSVED